MRSYTFFYLSRLLDRFRNEFNDSQTSPRLRSHNEVILNVHRTLSLYTRVIYSSEGGEAERWKIVRRKTKLNNERARLYDETMERILYFETENRNILRFEYYTQRLKREYCEV